MKKLILILPALLLMCCTPSDKKMSSMQGAYKMLTQGWNDGKKDTSVLSSQMKIYTDSHFMYAGISSDSVDSFGIGEYSFADGVAAEKSMFSSSDSSTSTGSSSFKLEITKTDKGYQQIIRDMQGTNGTFTLTETYETVSKDVPSPLNGAWKGIKFTVIQNGDTTTYPIQQFKVYGAGNFIFGHSAADSTGRKSTGIGYGTFEVVSDTKIKETIQVSTYNIAGRTFEIAIEILDDAHFRQTIVDGTSTQIEEYERLKKQ